MDSEHAAAIAALLRGDPETITAVRAAIRAVVRAFQFRGRDIERDLAQEALSRVVENVTAGRYRGEAALRTYAQQVAKFVCLEHIRRKRAEVRIDFESLPSPERWSGPEESLLLDEEHARNLEAFAALPAESRELLRLVFVEGLSYAELAQRFGLSESAIKSRIHRLRLECRERLGRRIPAPARTPWKKPTEVES
ncbi:MAG TPA: sigma-70 family RNA polymerase sigma factor [Candidatus Polarisedimenticolia bacterium]|nr:sigma-70 family RNA polymerase sigma factor [Candidatus Polarisedimenticolia bacterium]